MKTSTKKHLGFWTLSSLVAGNMIGAGVFMLPSALAKFGNIGLIAWALTAVGAILLALVFARLSLRISKGGGPYAYCQAAFGDFIGFEIAYNYWIAAWVGNAAVAVAFVGYLSFFWPTLQQNPIGRFFIEAGLVWFYTAVNIFGLRAVSFMQLVTTILKIFPLILITALGIFFIHPAHFTETNLPSQTNFFSGINAAAILTLWSFIGLESATIPSENAENHSAIVRATMCGVLFAAALYLTSMIVIVGIIPYSTLQASANPYAEAASIIFGNIAHVLHVSTQTAAAFGGGLIALGALISCAGCLNGWTLMQALVPMAAARDGIFPSIFAKTNKNGTPVYSLVISAIVITILLSLTLNASLVKQFTLIILLATLSQLIPYFFTCCAEIFFLMTDKNKFDKQHLGKYLTLSILAALYAFWAIGGAGQDLISYGMLLFLSGVFIYALMIRKKA